jgi:hypothetical protein
VLSVAPTSAGKRWAAESEWFSKVKDSPRTPRVEVFLACTSSQGELLEGTKGTTAQ